MFSCYKDIFLLDISGYSLLSDMYSLACLMFIQRPSLQINYDVLDELFDAVSLSLVLALSVTLSIKPHFPFVEYLLLYIESK